MPKCKVSHDEDIVPLKVDRIFGIWRSYLIYPEPYSIYLRGTIPSQVRALFRV